jgi:hypothetical protein
MNNKVIYWVLGAVLLAGILLGLCFAFKHSVTSEATEPYRSSMAGEYVCLLHKDSGLTPPEECTFGIRTSSGDYYAIDLSLMSQEHRPLTLGEQISANGLVTPIERLSSDHWQRYEVKGIFSVTDSLTVTEDEGGPYACHADAKICPDGSAVGRQGPNCEFAACPAANATSSRVTTYLGGDAVAMNVSVSPQKVVSDSRCPQGVTCVWAGTVQVRTVLSTQVSHGEHVLTLGEPQLFGEHTVTLIDVSPVKNEAAIPDSSYRFTFEIKKN